MSWNSSRLTFSSPGSVMHRCQNISLYSCDVDPRVSDCSDYLPASSSDIARMPELRTSWL
jgi:hypothetical protein